MQGDDRVFLYCIDCSQDSELSTPLFITLFLTVHKSRSSQAKPWWIPQLQGCRRVQGLLLPRITTSYTFVLSRCQTWEESFCQLLLSPKSNASAGPRKALDALSDLPPDYSVYPPCSSQARADPSILQSEMTRHCKWSCFLLEKGSP